MIRPFVALAKKKYFRIGVVGYSSKYFDKKKARSLLEKGIKAALKHNIKDEAVEIVSGLTNIGIPALAYTIACEHDYRTSGYACGKAEDFQLFDVDEKHIVGKKWGDESEEFLANLDVLIRVGGGEQSHTEVKAMQEKNLPVFEYDLEPLASLCLMGFVDSKIAKELRQQVGDGKAHELLKPSEYHATIRHWYYDPSDTKHLKNVTNYLKERLVQPTAFDVALLKETDVWGAEKSYVLHLESDLLMKFQKEIDKQLQEFGAPKSDYGEYKPHLTVGEDLEFKPKIDLERVTLNKWKLTTKNDAMTPSEVVWESEVFFKSGVSNTRTVVARFEQLKEVQNIEDVLDFLVFRTSDEIVDKCVFDHLLLVFLAQLPGFDGRNDFDEHEIEAFKEVIAYEDLHLDKKTISHIIKQYRSINRILDEIIEHVSVERKREIAREHIRNFWFDKAFGGDLPKFVSSLRSEFWDSSKANR